MAFVVRVEFQRPGEEVGACLLGCDNRAGVHCGAANATDLVMSKSKRKVPSMWLLGRLAGGCAAACQDAEGMQLSAEVQ